MWIKAENRRYGEEGNRWRSVPLGFPHVVTQRAPASLLSFEETERPHIIYVSCVYIYKDVPKLYNGDGDVHYNGCRW